MRVCVNGWVGGCGEGNLSEHKQRNLSYSVNSHVNVIVDIGKNDAGAVVVTSCKEFQCTKQKHCAGAVTLMLRAKSCLQKDEGSKRGPRSMKTQH